MSRERRAKHDGRSIFRSIFVPLFLIMLLQAAIFYFAAVYGGVEESLSQNAADILSERLQSQKNELEAQFNNRSFDLDACVMRLDNLYSRYESAYGLKPLARDAQTRIQFLADSGNMLIETLRQNEVNGIFLIISDKEQRQPFSSGGIERKYGLCIRDMDQDSNYTGREDLLLERSPSSIVESLGCSLDSWWEAYYTFNSEEHGDYYYYPLNAAWENPNADGSYLAYLSGSHKISGSDQAVVSYSIPLMDDEGYPYGVLGIELTTKYLASLLPNNGLEDMSKPCYVLAFRDAGSPVCSPVVGSGALFNRNFGSDDDISCENIAPTGGFTIMGRGDIMLYGDDAKLNIYNNNNPFEDREFVLLAIADRGALFAYINRVKLTLLLVSLFCLALGLVGILLVSRRFAAPITELAGRVRDLKPQAGFALGRLGITEIDQLVESIETLNRNVSRSSARTEFFSRMSHDMRTPMNAIISFSSPVLLEGASEAVKDDYLEKIQASGTYLLGLINEVLDMTKIESNMVELHLEPIQGRRLCDTTIPIIEKLAQKKKITFKSDISVDPDVYVLADIQHLNQIVINLLSNAVKFTANGGNVRFSIHMNGGERPGGVMDCSITVEDDGIGMSEEFMKDLFMPFEQENNTHEGTGLGLSIAKKLVELMSGKISCKSRQGVGTVFTVELPLIRCEPVAMETREPLPERTRLEELRGKRVLLCEDNALNIQIVSHLLAKIGITVDNAPNGLIGVSMFEASAPNTYDAILMDVRMPVMDGLDATRSIRALERPDAAAVPIIAMTANAFDEDVQACKEAGMNEHLAKPLETRRFFDILYRYICM